jgi:putative phage-type endonuclease
MRILCTTQNTPEWHAARSGRVTASQIARVLAAPGSKTREAYKLQLVLDLEGVPNMDSDEIPPWFRYGKTNEPEARAWYSWTTGRDVLTTGLIAHPRYEWLACSPDGLVGDDGLLELKCRASLSTFRTHVRRSAIADTPSKLQVQAQLLVTARAWCDLVNYHRDGDDEHGHIVRVFPDLRMQRRIEDTAVAFWGEVLSLYRHRQRKGDT